MTQEIAAGLAALGITATPETTEAMAEHVAMVAEWNRAYNLTAAGESSEMVSRHVLDSAAALAFLRGGCMLDVGSGAGFPGIVLALLAPETSWTLVEANGKKARFLGHAVRHLGLADRVSVMRERLEDYEPAAAFDTLAARAVADLATLVRWAAPLLAPAGRVVALKGRRERIESEREALDSSWRVELTPVKVPNVAAERHIVVLERR